LVCQFPRRLLLMGLAFRGECEQGGSPDETFFFAEGSAVRDL